VKIDRIELAKRSVAIYLKTITSISDLKAFAT